MNLAARLAFAEQGALTVLVWSWQALVLLACVWAGLKLLHVPTPALRQRVWLLALLAVAMLPLWPQMPAAWPPRAQPSAAMRIAAELPRIVMTPAVAPIVPDGTFVTLNKPPARTARPLVLPALFCLWLAGMLFTLLRYAQSAARLRQARRQAQPVSLVELGCAHCTEQAAPFALSTSIRSPLLHGVWRPLILLPHDLSEWTSVAEREAMLAHELAHLARRDHFTNLLPVALNTVFFFHPLVRYACRQFCLERELACDDHVIHHGADAATYAESLLKAAERSLHNAAAFGLHQPAFFTAKQFLERRIEMILNTNRVRALAHQWRYLALPLLLIGALTVLLSSSAMSGKPASLTKAQQDDLVERALTNPDANVRLTTIQRLTQITGERGTLSLLEVYQRSADDSLKEAVIRSLAAREEEQPLAAISQVEENPGLQQVLRQVFNDLLSRKHNVIVAAGKVPPPPPPPVRASLPPINYEFQVIGSEPRNLLRPLGLVHWAAEGKVVGAKLKLPHFNLIAPSATKFVIRELAFYFLDRFEVELESNTKLYGRGVLRVTPKFDGIEYALSPEGGIYRDSDYTQKVELAEFLR